MSNLGIELIQEARKQLATARVQRDAYQESPPDLAITKEESIPSQALAEQISAYGQSHPGTVLVVVRRLVVVDDTAEVDYLSGEGVPDSAQLVQFSLTTTVADANNLSTSTELVLAQVGS